MSAEDSTLVSHLEALRSTLLRSLAVFGIGIIPAFLAAPYILERFTATIASTTGAPLHYFSPMEVFLLQLKIAAILDLAICSPCIAYNIWKFILPALYEREIKFIRSITWMTSGLFIAGVVFCLCICFPFIVKFGMSFQGINLTPIFGISNVVSLALWLALAFGTMFQFPLVTYALIRADIVRYKTAAHARPYVMIGILLLSALLTPPDIVSQLILGIPTYLLFEAGLLASRKFQ